jgi:hypothetical protein
LSPIDIYAGPILDAAFDAASGIKTSSYHVIFSCMGGDMALPIPDLLRKVSIVVNVDWSGDYASRELAEVEEDSVPLIRALFSSLGRQLEELPTEDRNAAEALLVEALLAGERQDS